MVVVKNQKEWLRMKRLTHVSGWKELEKLKKLFKDQKIKIDPILKYRRTKESEVFVDTTQIRAGKMDVGAHNIQKNSSTVVVR